MVIEIEIGNWLTHSFSLMHGTPIIRVLYSRDERSKPPQKESMYVVCIMYCIVGERDGAVPTHVSYLPTYLSIYLMHGTAGQPASRVYRLSKQA